jgi:hypothetical protein
MSQYEIIIKASKKRFISPLDALNLNAGMKLSTRIGELKQKGYVFLDKWNKDKSFKLYKCISEPKGEQK